MQRDRVGELPFEAAFVSFEEQEIQMEARRPYLHALARLDIEKIKAYFCQSDRIIEAADIQWVANDATKERWQKINLVDLQGCIDFLIEHGGTTAKDLSKCLKKCIDKIDFMWCYMYMGITYKSILLEGGSLIRKTMKSGSYIPHSTKKAHKPPTIHSEEER